MKNEEGRRKNDQKAGTGCRRLRRFTAAASLLAVMAATAPAAAEPVRVVTSIPDFAAVAKAIGGDLVEAESIVKGNRDVHAVEILPSFFVKIRRADVYVKVGLDLDMWAQQLVDGSRNAKLVIVDASTGIEPLEVPTFKVDASHGDLHKYGNPHYWLDPANLRPIADAIVGGLSQAAPEHETTFRTNAGEYLTRVERALAGWQQRLAPLAGVEVVSFHNTWPYFARRFNIVVVDYLEPKPGVPPTPTHIAAIEARLKTGRVRVILMESYFDDRVPNLISRDTGVPVVKVPILCGAAPGTDDPIALFETITGALAAAIRPPSTP
jgi:ABC-type Zn uptake system ZnuABC Zn-binding protein ZnuA